MADVSIRLRGVGDIRALRVKVARIPRALTKEGRRRTAQIAEASVGIAKRTTRGSRTRAKRKGRAVTAPRGILGLDTGRGRQSITWKWGRVGRRVYQAIVYSSVGYMNIQERRGRYRWLKPAMPRIRRQARAISRGRLKL